MFEYLYEDYMNAHFDHVHVDPPATYETIGLAGFDAEDER